jgi:hypothetical protein
VQDNVWSKDLPGRKSPRGDMCHVLPSRQGDQVSDLLMPIVQRAFRRYRRRDRSGMRRRRTGRQLEQQLVRVAPEPLSVRF